MNLAPELQEKFDYLQSRYPQTIDGNLGIEYLKLEKEELIARMPVDARTQQPFGLLHGGASVVLAESLASLGGWFNVNEKKYAVVGLEINANHVRSAYSGFVTGRAVPIHIGGKTHIWEITITNDQKKLVCISRCTLAVIPTPIRKDNGGSPKSLTKDTAE